MKRIIELVKYQLQIYFKGSKFVMPLVVMILFLYTMYSIKPEGVVSSFILSCNFAFLLMVWIGLTVVSGENPVSEQILLLRISNNRAYYLSKILFQTVQGFFVSCILILFPVVYNMMNHYDLFLRPLTGYDVLNAFILLCGCTFAGGAMGGLLHPRVIKNRKMAIILTLVFTALTVTKTAIAEEAALTRFVTWVLPPVADMSSLYGNEEFFRLHLTLLLFLGLLFWGACIYTCRSMICYRKKF